jgi:hypothetical protein
MGALPTLYAQSVQMSKAVNTMALQVGESGRDILQKSNPMNCHTMKRLPGNSGKPLKS